MAKKQPDYPQRIINFIKANPKSSSQQILNGLGIDISIATLKRALQKLIAEQLVSSTGKLKSTKYEISTQYAIVRPIDVNQYFEKEIDERVIQNNFNHLLLKEILSKISLFTKEELSQLNQLQNVYTSNSSKLTPSEYKNELERLAIDLSWKSSQIEGNTYSLLETERLLKDKETAAGKTKDEATMLLNHKDAIDFIVANPDYIKTLYVSSIEDIHSILVKELGISKNVRNRRVGISGTNYKPLDNEFQIKEALKDMCSIVNNNNNVFEKALLTLVLISYIQPFADGNKRTARIIGNAILMSNHYCPVSFRTIDSVEYKKAMLIFYEQNNINPFKKIFINQFEFAVKTYF
ncbi:Fic family protein [Ferruginibacter sp.]